MEEVAGKVSARSALENLGINASGSCGGAAMNVIKSGRAGCLVCLVSPEFQCDYCKQMFCEDHIHVVECDVDHYIVEMSLRCNDCEDTIKHTSADEI